jgi:hypothetical protein
MRIDLKNKMVEICFYIGSWPLQVREAFSNPIIMKLTCGNKKVSMFAIKKL